MEQNELYHHGVLGMKWGRRKATNTTAGDKHIHKMERYRDKLVKKKLNLSENGLIHMLFFTKLMVVSV
jgi:hypothetical protein